MGFDNYSEQGNRNHSYGYDFHNHYQEGDIKELILNKLRDNPGLKKWFFLAAIILVVVVLVIVVALAPLLMKLLTYVSENGIQGLIDTLWKGFK